MKKPSLAAENYMLREVLRRLVSVLEGKVRKDTASFWVAEAKWLLKRRRK